MIFAYQCGGTDLYNSRVVKESVKVSVAKSNRARISLKISQASEMYEISEKTRTPEK